MTQVPQGVKICAYMFYAVAALAVLGLCVSVVVNGLALASSSGDSSAMTGILIGMATGACPAIIFAALYGFVGYSLMQMQKWARIAAIILAVLALCGFPIGTILGGIVLYFMFANDEVKAAFA